MATPAMTRQAAIARVGGVDPRERRFGFSLNAIDCITLDTSRHRNVHPGAVRSEWAA
jgi:hypothetical protein